MVRLKDIAARAGVSVMTVSKCLRNATDISATTKARVQALAQQMGYLPDVTAQGLRNRTTRLLGLLIPSTTSPMTARMVMGLEERAHDLGYDLLLAHSMNRPDREESALRRFLSRRVDGIFLSPVYRMDPTAAIYEELQRQAVPTVLLGHSAPFCAAFSNVETDDQQASYALTQHLLEIGHRRIAFLAGPAVIPSARERLEGYQRALREAQVEPDEGLVFMAGTTIEEGEKAALELLEESPGATAVQAVNDLVAIGAARIFLQQGLQIPGDISLAGFGNIHMAEHFRIPLTTIRQPKFRLGLAAMEMMSRLLAGEAPETRRLSAELVVRQSTAPPAGS